MRFIIPVVVLSLVIGSCSTPHETSTSASGSQSYVAPGYEKKKYKKIMVMALLAENTYRKRAENSLVSELKDRGFKVVPSTEIFTNEMLKDTAAMRTTAQAAGIDATILIRYLGNLTSTADQAHTVGTMYSFYGYNYAVIDMQTNSIQTGFVQLDFFVEDKLGTQYRTGIPFKQSNAVDDAFTEFAIQARRRLLNDKIL